MAVNYPDRLAENTILLPDPKDEKADANIYVASIFRDLDIISKIQSPAGQGAIPEGSIDPLSEYQIRALTLDPYYFQLVPESWIRLIGKAEAAAERGVFDWAVTEVEQVISLFFQYDTRPTLYLLCSPSFRYAATAGYGAFVNRLFNELKAQGQFLTTFCEMRWMQHRNLIHQHHPSLRDYYHGPPVAMPDGTYASSNAILLKGQFPVHPHAYYYASAGGIRKHGVELIDSHVPGLNLETMDDPVPGSPEDFYKSPFGIISKEHSACLVCKRRPVDLVEYPAKGIGARSLSQVGAREYIGEYVGVVNNLDAKGGDYCMDLDTSVIHPESDPVVIGRIDSELAGNWARFINHSCEPNAQYVRRVVGQEVRYLIRTTKAIRCFDEICCDYGDEYFAADPPIFCQCKTPSCKFASLAQIRAWKNSR